jgi:hypothetical protein
MSHERVMVDTRTQVHVLTQVAHQLGVRIAQHGPESFIGPHETLGILWEEFAELCDAVRANDRQQVRAELMDIAVAAVFGIASQDDQDRPSSGSVGARGPTDPILEPTVGNRESESPRGV